MGFDFGGMGRSLGLDRVGRVAQRGLNEIVDAGRSIGSAVINPVGDVASAAVSAAKSGYDAAAPVVSDVWDTASSFRQRAADGKAWAEQRVSDAGDWVSDKGQSVQNWIDDSRNSIEEFGDRHGGVVEVVADTASFYVGFENGVVLGAKDAVVGIGSLAYDAGELMNPVEWLLDPQDNIGRLNTTATVTYELGSLTSASGWATRPEQNLQTASALWDGISAPYREGDLAQGLGRGAFDIGSLFIPGGGVTNAATRGGRIAALTNRVDDAVHVLGAAGRLDDVGLVGRTLTREAPAVARVLPDDVAGAAAAAGGHAAPGPANFMSNKDKFFLNASHRADVDANGVFDVVAHGSPNQIQVVTRNGPVLVDHRTASHLIASSPGYTQGQPVRLLSCSTGACDSGFAQNLANKLNVPVQAPTDLVWAYSDGTIVVAPRSPTSPKLPDLANQGTFRTFTPGDR